MSADANWLLKKSHCTLYVNLLCEYDPDNVLPFLRTSDHLVDVHERKEDCKLCRPNDGAAYLLEREGDVFGALPVLIEKERCGKTDGLFRSHFANMSSARWLTATVSSSASSLFSICRSSAFGSAALGSLSTGGGFSTR